MTHPSITHPSLNHAHLSTLPDDALLPILAQLSLLDLLHLLQTNHLLRSRIDTLGIPLYLSNHRVAHHTLCSPPSSWNPLDLVRYNHSIDRSIERHRWYACQVGPIWSRAVIPTLHLAPDRLVLGVGGKMLVHPLIPPDTPLGSSEGAESEVKAKGKGKVVAHARQYTLTRPESGTRSDIVGIVPTHDSQGFLVVAQFDGTVQRLILPESGANVPRVTARYTRPSINSSSAGVGAGVTARTGIGGSGSIHTFTGSEDGQTLLTTLASGHASLQNTNAPWIEPSTIALQSQRAWSSLLTTSSTRSPHAMFGVSGSIDVHPLRPSGLDPTPSRRLHGPELPLTSSAYGMVYPDEGSSHNPNLLLSAWYDSHLRLHDLREPQSHRNQSSSSILVSTSTDPSLGHLPRSTFSDPYTWADGSAFYTCSFLGSHHVAGGCARHGTVAIFDLRQPKKARGWSCFSPGGKGSPVYALKGDGGRLWGVTERRAFVFSFVDGEGGAVAPEARANRGKTGGRGGREVVNGYKGRGGKWGWTVRYDQDEGTSARGYEHRDRGVELFDSLAIE